MENISVTHVQVVKFDLIKVSLILPFVIINPILLLIHGYFWFTEGQSKAFLVYALKLSPFVYLSGALIVIGLSGIRKILKTRAIKIYSVFMVLGLIVPLAEVRELSWFYYFADAAGLAATFAYFSVTAYILGDQDLGRHRDKFIKVMISGAGVTSLVIVLIYIWTSGEKISLPPDIHYGITLALLFYLLSDFKKFHWRIWPLIIAAGAGAAQFRMNLLVVILAICSAWFFLIIRRNCQGCTRRMLATILILAAMILPFHESIQATVSRMALVTWNLSDALALIRKHAPILGTQSGQLTNGGAVDQRYVEAKLVIDEMVKNPISFLTGYGFGATFANAGGVLGDGLTKHTVHNSVFTILLRNGIFAVLIFLAPAFFALASALRKSGLDRESFVAAVGLLVIYLACMTDQYVYWGGYFGIALAVWWTSIHAHAE